VSSNIGCLLPASGRSGFLLNEQRFLQRRRLGWMLGLKKYREKRLNMQFNVRIPDNDEGRLEPA
jgi:hypothetical protein